MNLFLLNSAKPSRLLARAIGLAAGKIGDVEDPLAAEQSRLPAAL
jgi:hypothetical protein